MVVKNLKNFLILFDATVRDNFDSFGTKEVLPAWFERSWQALWNRNDHMQNHGVAPRSDQSSTYSYQDPITSFSFGHGGILVLTPQTSGKGQKNAVSRGRRCFNYGWQISA